MPYRYTPKTVDLEKQSMLRTTTRTILLVISLGITQLWAGTIWADTSAPFSDLVDIDGNAVTTEADVGIGKWQIVMIWAIDCHICREMKPKMSAFHEKHKDKTLEVYGLALDGPENVEAVQQYMIRHKVKFPTFIGNFDPIAAKYEEDSKSPLSGTPTYMLFNPEGKLVGTDFGFLNVEDIEKFIESSS